VFTFAGEEADASSRLPALRGVRYRKRDIYPTAKMLFPYQPRAAKAEFWKYPANGVGAAEQWTRNSKVLRWDGVPSPDGRWLAHRDKDQQLWIYDIGTRQDSGSLNPKFGDFDNLTWSPTAVG